MTADAVESRYPKSLELRDGTAVTLQLMGPKDRDAILQFAGGLPADDLLFLRVDITSKAGVDDWLDNVKHGNSTSVLAYAGDTLVGYASVARTPARWTRRVGELRVNVAANHRRTGLGRTLTAEIFDVARALGLKKLSAQMTPDQQGARSVFLHLGFQVEALLTDWVEDRHGRARDLVVMSYDLEGFHDTMAEPLKL